MKKDTSWFQWYDTLQQQLFGGVKGTTLSNDRHDVADVDMPTAWSYDVLHGYLVRHLRNLELTAPFSWRAYLCIMRRAYLRTHPHVRLEITSAHLPQGTFAQWVVVARPAPDNSVDKCSRPRREDVTAQLLIAQSSDESLIERAVYHEVGHLELGHLLLTLDLPVESAPGAAPPSETSDAEPERDAELFATILQRLAHGWDPAALPAPRLDDFFHVIG